MASIVDPDPDDKSDKRRVLTDEECDQLFAAVRDPDYIARLLADHRSGVGMVEVDNPFRRELRPRRGTDEVR